MKSVEAPLMVQKKSPSKYLLSEDKEMNELKRKIEEAN